jgi:uncharacterized protein YfaS (alpha-2-macroglobulin family)
VFGKYVLTIKTENYEETKNLVYALADAAFQLEFDKTLYAPGQVVKGRVYAFNSETNAVTPKRRVYVNISDSNGDTVFKSGDVEFKKGKFEFNFNLASDALFGYYQVTVYQTTVYDNAEAVSIIRTNNYRKLIVYVMENLERIWQNLCD